MDWDLWIGPAPMREYNAKYAPFAWRGWWDFGCGAMGDMACHIMDPCYRALKLNEAEYLLPAETMAAYTRPEPTIPRIENEDHYKDWIDGIKGDPKPGSSFDYSGPFTEMVVFGNLSVRTGKKLHWDNIKGKMTNGKKAAELISKEYRKGWELPC